jgi:hypothetical protein
VHNLIRVSEKDLYSCEDVSEVALDHNRYMNVYVRSCCGKAYTRSETGLIASCDSHLIRESSSLFQIMVKFV